MDLSLKRLGFLVRTSEEPSEILSILEMEKPQVVLLDLFLLGYSSLELLRQIKDSGLLEHTRVIVISAFGFMEVLQQAIILGAADFVVKPFDMDVLAAKVLRGLTAL
ncbi:MAG: response regulator [Anaerolineae bacterium]|nr:response regulator [Anaerolineae bacterium]